MTRLAASIVLGLLVVSVGGAGCGSSNSGGSGGGTAGSGGGAAGGGSGGGSGGSSGGCAGTLVACGAQCIDTAADVLNCGACGNVCGQGRVCNQKACAVLPSDCTTSSGCGPGYFCDPVTKACAVGCRLPADCPQGATCTASACQCPSGTHACGQTCVSNTGATSCGSSCIACPQPANSTASCEASGCAFTCATGFVKRGDACIANCTNCTMFKASLMFLVDKSGSMNFPSDPANPACPAGCGVSTGPCPVGCPTRISELRSAMNTFITANGTAAWMGMAIFPTKASADACGPSVAADVLAGLTPKTTDLAADLTASAMAVNTQVQSLVPGGGTPTAGSLRFLNSYAPLQATDRLEFVVLLTDGLPNCNSTNPNTCNNGSPPGAACKCTLANCTASSFCAQGCLDKDNSAAAVAELKANNIRTIVVGFGAETQTGDGQDALNAMAEAGGFQRTCPNQTNAECGTGNTCTNKVCSKRFYQATTATELAAVLGDIARSLIP